MKFIIITLILLTLCFSSVTAQVANNNDNINPNQNFNPEGNINPEQARMFLEQSGIGNVAGDVAGQIESTLQPYITVVEYIIGGIFGLYFLLLLTRIYYERKKVNLLKDIRFDLDQLNQYYKVPHSAHRKGFFGRLWAKIRGR